MLALFLVLGGAYVFYKISHIDEQIGIEIEQLQLPIDSVAVDYDNERILFDKFNLSEMLLHESQNLDSASIFLADQVEANGVDWWTFYNSKVLKVDTLWINGLDIQLNSHDLALYELPDSIPVDRIQANVLIARGDSIYYEDSSSYAIQSGGYELVKQHLDIEMKQFEFHSLFEEVQAICTNIHVRLKNYPVNCTVDSLKFSGNRHMLTGISIDTDVFNSNQTNIIIEDVPLMELVQKTAQTIPSVRISCRGPVQLKESFSLDDWEMAEWLEDMSIENLQIVGNSLEASKGLGMFKSIKSGYFEVESKYIDLNNSASLLSNCTGNIRQFDFELTENNAFGKVGLVRLSRDQLALQDGSFQMKRSNIGSAEIEFEKIQFWKKHILRHIQTNYQVDSIVASIERAVIEEDLISPEKKDSTGLLNQLKSEKISISAKNVTLLTESSSPIEINSLSATSSKGGQSIANIIGLNQVHFDIDAIQFGSATGYQQYRLGGITMDQSNVRFENLVFESNQGSRVNSNTSIRVIAPAFEMSIEAFQKYLAHRQMYFDYISVSDLEMYIVTDEEKYDNEGYKALLSEALLQYEIPIDIGRLELKNASLQFDYRPKNDDAFSQIHFNKADFVFDNICNIKARLGRNRMMDIKGTAQFMSKAPFKIDAHFDLLDTDFAYQYKLELGTIEFVEINDLLTDLAGLKIKKGRLDKLLCNVDANKYHSKGVLDFYYRNLKVRYDKEKFIEQWNPVNFMITRFVLDQDNRQEWEHETGVIDIARESDKSMYYQIWAAIFAGMKYVMMPVI